MEHVIYNTPPFLRGETGLSQCCDLNPDLGCPKERAQGRKEAGWGAREGSSASLGRELGILTTSFVQRPRTGAQSPPWAPLPGPDTVCFLLPHPKFTVGLMPGSLRLPTPRPTPTFGVGPEHLLGICS